MKLTRRNLLKALAAAPLVAAIPTLARALSPSDIVVVPSSRAMTITIHEGAEAEFKVGEVLRIIGDKSALRIDVDEGITLSHDSMFLPETRGPHAMAELTKIGKREWYLEGDLARDVA